MNRHGTAPNKVCMQSQALGIDQPSMGRVVPNLSLRLEILQAFQMTALGGLAGLRLREGIGVPTASLSADRLNRTCRSYLCGRT